MEWINLPVKKIPVREKFDVLVVGAGMAGVCAAICSARSGLKTGLIEYFGCPGGIPTSGLLGVISGFRLEEEQVVGGMALEFVERLKKVEGVYGNWHYIFDPEKLKSVLLEMLTESGVETYFYTQMIGAIKEGFKATHAVIASKSGLESMRSRLFIDGTGDGDLAVHVGCPYERGRESDGLTQSSTLVFTIAGIDREKALASSEMTKVWRTKNHRVPTNHICINYLPRPGKLGEASVNMTHILRFDGTKSTDLTRARFEGTRQANEVLAFFKDNFPGFENAYISQTAAQIGVRETRRIIGDYILTEEDVLKGKSFKDEVVRCCWGIDVHNPDGNHTGIGINLKKSYGIPYRCLTPLKIDNLFIVGRAISTTHRANSSTRINSTCIGTGQAAGCAAKQAIEAGATRKVDVEKLRKVLREQGAII